MLKVARIRDRNLSVALREKAPTTPLPTQLPPDFSILVEDCPENFKDLLDLTAECMRGILLPTHIANVPTRTTYSLSCAEEQALNAAPKFVKEMTFAINSERMELH